MLWRCPASWWAFILIVILLVYMAGSLIMGGRDLHGPDLLGLVTGQPALHLWTTPGLQEFSSAIRTVLAVICPACLRGIFDRWP